MKNFSKAVIIILAVIAFLGAAFLAVWQFDVFGFFKDYKAVPAITLLGDKNMTLEGGTAYEEPGYSATISGEDASKSVEVDYSALDITKVGKYDITYTLSNLKGRNTVTAVRTVEIVDTTAPVISLKGEESVRVLVGTEYKDAGATAADKVDGDLSKNIKVQNNVNVNEKGKYTVVYTVADAAGNTATAQREVIVYKRSSGSVVYLTFDDGPSENTAKILDLLKKYNAHATFFVVGQNIYGHEDLIKRIFKEGHTLAVHTYTHDYAKIYKSEKAFWADNEKTRSLVKELTGYECKFMRFPGGASNTISANYSKGIMTALTSQTKAHGYEFFDWNISSGDAERDGVPAKKLYNNIMAGIHENYNTPIVLMHDSSAKTTTVKAVAKVLKVGLSEGYSFEAIDETTPAVHHGVNN